MTTDTFAALLDQALRHEPGRPLVTAYDEATGARTELSVTTYANWVAKTANLFADEYLLDAGDTVRLILPTHWLGPVFVGAALTTGVATTADDLAEVSLTVCGPLGDDAVATPALASSLTAFGTRFTEPLPEGVDDYGVLWPGQSDVFTGVPATGDAAAQRTATSEISQAELIATSREAIPAAARVLTDANLSAPEHQWLLLGALATGGSIVLISGATDDEWSSRYQAELPTLVVRSESQPPKR